MNCIVIFASSRKNGNTKTAIEHILRDIPHDLVVLDQFRITPFDYEHKNQNDDFIPLIEKIVSFDNIILATPVYWYAACAQMKIFIDRWSDLLSIRKDLGNLLCGKNVFVISTYASEFPLGYSAFEAPIRLSCHYMSINYGGCYYFQDGKKINESDKHLVEFRHRLKNSKSLEEKIHGDKIYLRLATLADRRELFEWMYCSDASKSMWGTPLFPDKPQKSWEDFKRSWDLFYFQKPLTSRGHILVIYLENEKIGGIAFHAPDHKNRSEIDIWLSSEHHCGKGFGTDAIHALCKYLYRQFGIMFFWVMPSERNPRSISAFQKVGFKSLPLTPDEGKQEFGFQDYHDSVYLLKDMSIDA